MPLTQADDPIVRPAYAAGLGYCLYRSMARPGTSVEDVERIVDHSRRRNLDRDLTGCLHYEDGVFFQWLEGPWQQIFRLMDILREDVRHWQITVLDQGRSERRLFQNWHMYLSDPEAASLFDWLSDWRGHPDAGNEVYVARVNQFLTAVAARP